MKKSVTQFDLSAAFKALDEMEYPKVEGGILPNRVDLKENFGSRKLRTDILVEDYYDVNDNNDLEAAAEEREGEVAKAKLARIEKIVDLDAESEDDLLTSYEGKVIIQCPQCMTLFYKNEEDLETDENNPDVVNINETCQHCGNTSGYMVIGKVAPVDEAELDNFDTEDFEEEPAEETEEEVAEEEPAEEEDLGDLDALDLDFDEEEPAEEEANESLNKAAIQKEVDKKHCADNDSENLTLNEELTEDKGEAAEQDKLQAKHESPIEEAKKVCDKCGKEICECDKQELKESEVEDIIKSVVNSWDLGEACEGKDCSKVKDDINQAVSKWNSGDKPQKPTTADNTKEINDVMNNWSDGTQIPEPAKDKKATKAAKRAEKRIGKITSTWDEGLDEIEDAVQRWDSDRPRPAIVPDDTEPTKAIEDTVDSWGDDEQIPEPVKDKKAAKRAEKRIGKSIDSWGESLNEEGNAAWNALSNEPRDRYTIIKKACEEAKNAGKSCPFAGGKWILYGVDKDYNPVETKELPAATKPAEAKRVRDELLNSNENIIGVYVDRIFKETASGKAEEVELYKYMKFKPGFEDDGVEESLDECKGKDCTAEEAIKDILVKESLNKAEVQADVDKKHCAENDSENLTLNEAAEEEAIEDEVAEEEIPAEAEDIADEVANEETAEEAEENADEEALNEQPVETTIGEVKEVAEEVAEKVAEPVEDEEAAEEQAEEIKEVVDEVVEDKFAEEADDLENEEASADEEVAEEETPAEEEVVDETEAEEEVEEALTEDNNETLSDKEFADLLASKEAQEAIFDENLRECDLQEVLDNIDDIDEESFEEAFTKALTNVYENVNNYKLKECAVKDGKLVVEGLINFKSNASRNATCTFDKAQIRKLTNELILEGYSKDFAKQSNFKISCAVEDNGKNLFVENLNYSYKIGENLVEGYTRK